MSEILITDGINVHDGKKLETVYIILNLHDFDYPERCCISLKEIE
jgi:hypothetical protein